MLYIQHNIKSNYMSAAGSGDRQMAFDILLSEIAKLIIYRHKVVIQELKNAGYAVKSDKPSNSELIRLVSEGLYSNPEFAKAIARQMMLNQKPVDAQNFSEGGTKNIGGSSELQAGIGELFGGKGKNMKAKEQATKDLAEKIEGIERFYGKKTSLAREIAKGVLVAILVSGIGYLTYKIFA